MVHCRLFTLRCDCVVVSGSVNCFLGGCMGWRGAYLRLYWGNRDGLRVEEDRVGSGGGRRAIVSLSRLFKTIEGDVIDVVV